MYKNIMTSTNDPTIIICGAGYINNGMYKTQDPYNGDKILYNHIPIAN